MKRGPPFALLFALALALLGCSRSGEPVEEIRAWILQSSGSEVAVTLPGHLDGAIPAERSRYSLRARVTLDSALRGRDLVLAVPGFPALVTARANGAPLDDVDPSTTDVYRSRGPHAWRVPRALVERGDPGGSGVIELALDVDHTWPMSGWVEGVPRLSATTRGDAAFLATSHALDWGNALALGTLAAMGFTHLLLFLLARSRRHHGWFALQAMTAAHYPLFLSGWTQVLGRFDTGSLALTQTIAGVAGLQFTYAAFELGRAPRWPWVATAIASALGFAILDPFVQVHVVAPVTLATCLATTGFHVTRLARVARSRTSQRATAAILGASWAFVLLTVILDGGAYVGLGAWLGGVRAGSWGLAIVSIAQSAALSREHVEALRRADAAVEDLGQRVREIEALNGELRRRIAERSRDVGAAVLAHARGAARAWPAIGARFFGRYRVDRLAGVGGMGRVYEVTRERDGARFALKVMGRAATGETIARFAREAELAARVSHPNVVSIVDFDVSDEGVPFLVMDLVAGASLAKHRDRYGDVAWACAVLAQVAAGLDAVHARGIVHRDVKPGNVLVEGVPAVKARITDFGVSCVAPTMDDSVTQDTIVDDATAELTGTGLILGTPAYMAPELARGARHATPAADVFAFAVLAFELLTGRYPFAEPPVTAERRGARATPFAALRELAPDAPAELADAIDATLRCDPPLRPPASRFVRLLGATTARAA
jgi:hypothetical protein